MAEKMLLNDQVKILSTRLNVPSTTVKMIIDHYSSLLKEEIQLGMEVRVGSVLRFVPTNGVTNSYMCTTGYEATVIAKNTSVPYVTVLTILTSYLDLIEESIKELKGFDIVGLVNIKSKLDDSGKIKVSSSTSRTLMEKLITEDNPVRVKFNINLRHLLGGQAINGG